MTLKPWPVIVGVLVDILGGFFLVVAYMLVVVGTINFESAASVNDVYESDWIVFAVLGYASTATGGYVAARKAAVAHIHHGVAVGIVTLIIALVLTIGATGEAPPWHDLTGLMSLPAGAIGGYLARRNAGTLSSRVQND